LTCAKEGGRKKAADCETKKILVSWWWWWCQKKKVNLILITRPHLHKIERPTLEMEKLWGTEEIFVCSWCRRWWWSSVEVGANIVAKGSWCCGGRGHGCCGLRSGMHSKKGLNVSVVEFFSGSCCSCMVSDVHGTVLCLGHNAANGSYKDGFDGLIMDCGLGIWVLCCIMENLLHSYSQLGDVVGLSSVM